jgi:hypothetical protein
MERHSNKPVPHIRQQSALLSNYLECIADHYLQFVAANGDDTSDAGVVYVIKNLQLGAAPVSVLCQYDWDNMCAWTEVRDRATIVVAEDYTLYTTRTWSAPRNHYLRGRDDYTLFHMARRAKKAYCRAIIMSNDKFDDYESMGAVPPFVVTTIHGGQRGRPEKVSPRPNALGQIADYTITRHNVRLVMTDDPLPAAPPDGAVWAQI